ncbi:C2 domain protein [Oesophagostomum dentatum]|uniref:C2 domain protein n=1 Tax=Oesophagostomum dentatum TaxID=61180 RepID=A0A0B1TDK2_OESDE|nr:C2 domain protein [Oesophagostomum dentatum]
MSPLNLVEEDNVLYILAGTIFVVSVVVITLFIKTKANRFEQNLVEMSMDAHHYRCKSFNRTDTDDDARSLDNFRERVQRPTRDILPVRDPLATTSVPTGDVSGKFVIPRFSRISQSMFVNPQQSQFDRGLYQCTPPDESACTDEMGSSGSIQLSLSLDANLNLLTVSLKQAYDLPSKRQDDNPNPYFRVALDIPEGAKTQQQTKTFRGTTSPEIGEDFYFQRQTMNSPVGDTRSVQIPAAQIASCRLEIMVYDYDQFSVDECVGYCWLTLGRLTVSLEKDNPTVFWAEVLPYDENGGSGYGEVLFSLAYLSQAQRLTMNIFKARNLRCRGDGAISMRVSLIGNDEKRLKRKKTASRRNVRNAQFNESLTFGVPKRSLCDVSLEIEVNCQLRLGLHTKSHF